jgi:hypothetical protein
VVSRSFKEQLVSSSRTLSALEQQTALATATTTLNTAGVGEAFAAATVLQRETTSAM